MSLHPSSNEQGKYPIDPSWLDFEVRIIAADWLQEDQLIDEANIYRRMSCMTEKFFNSHLLTCGSPVSNTTYIK